MSKKNLSKWMAGNLVKMWCPDAPPEIPSDCDDEFNDESFNTDKWAEFDLVSRQTISEEKYGLKLLIPSPENSGNSITGIYQTIPPGDFSITTKLDINARRGNFAIAGLTLWEDATDANKKIIGFGIYIASSFVKYSVYYYTNYTTSSTDYLNLTVGNDITAGYFRIRRTGTTYFFDISNDGVSFVMVYSNALIPFTPAHFGLHANIGSSAVPNQPEDVSALFKFFRYKNNSLTSPLEGRLLNIRTL